MIRRFLIGTVLTLSVFSTTAAELSQYTATRVQKAHQLAQEEKLKDAITMLEALEPSKSYDQAFVARMLGIFYWQNDQIKLAIKQLEFAVASDELEDEQSWQTKKMLADILLNEQQYSRALPHYYELVKTVPETQKEHEIWLRISQSHYQMSQWKQVLTSMVRYEKLYKKDELAPLSIRLSAEFELKKWKGAIVTLKRLIALEPDKIEWWRQLTSLYLRVDDSKRALDTLALAKLKGLPFNQDDIKLLVQLYAKRGVPERAAKLMNELDAVNTDSKLKSQQAALWQMAKEWDNAIKAWKIAAKLDSKFYWNLAQLEVQEGRYKDSLVTLTKVKGRKAEVALMKTRAYYKLKKFEDALAHAKRANEYKPSKQAKSWVDYLSQLKRVKASQQS